MLLEMIAGAYMVGAVIVIAEKITKSIARMVAQVRFKKTTGNVMIKMINNCTNEVSIEDLDTGEEQTIQGNGISDDLFDGMIISIGNAVDDAVDLLKDIHNNNPVVKAGRALDKAVRDAVVNDVVLKNAVLKDLISEAAIKNNLIAFEDLDSIDDNLIKIIK